MKISKLLVITLAAGLGVGGLFVVKAHAVERLAGHRALHGHLLERAKEKLGLTDEQVAKIKMELKGEKDTQAEISAQLTPDEQERFKKFRDEHRKLWEAK